MSKRRCQFVGYRHASSEHHPNLWPIRRSKCTLAASLAAWYLHDLASQYSDLDAEAIESAAKNLDIDIVRDWELQQSFLELFTKFQLVGLADEWNVDAGDDVDLSTMGKELLIQTLLEYAPEDEPPVRMRKLKPVSLR